MLDTIRDASTQDEEGAAGCEASEPAQQAGAGGPQHLPRSQRPGASGNPPADRDEAGQVSGSVWTCISLPSCPHPTLPSMYVCFITRHHCCLLSGCFAGDHVTKAFAVDAYYRAAKGCIVRKYWWYTLYYNI